MIFVLAFALCLQASTAQEFWACDGNQPHVITTPGSSFASKGYTGAADYEDNLSCTWKLSVTTPNMQLTFLEFEFEDSVDCANDYLQIYDGPDDTFPLVSTLCGTRGSAGNSFPLRSDAFLRMVTNTGVAGHGFQARMDEANLNDACDGGIIIRNETSGTIQSPNYPLNYPDNSACMWQIRAVNPDEALEFHFTACNLESSCDLYDYLYIYEGFSADNKELLRQDGLTTFNEFRFRNYGDVGATVIFETDASINRAGFSLDWVKVARDPRAP